MRGASGYGGMQMGVMERIGTKTRKVAKALAPAVEVETDRLIRGDCIASMRALPDACIDMIFADPPYNLQLGGDLNRPDGSHVDAVTDDWDKFDSFAAYDAFTRDWLKEARRILKPSGTIWVIGSYHNIFRVGATLQDHGLLDPERHRLAQGEPDAQFQGHPLHQRARDADLGEPEREGEIHLQLPRDEDAQRRAADALGLGAADLRRAGAPQEGRHQGPPDAEARGAALSRHARLHKPGDVVLDPFFGTGTTGAVAKRLGRKWIGMRAEDSYIEAALERIEAALPLDESAVAIMQTPRQAPKVAFGTLIETGYLAPGAILTDTKRRWKATVRVDGSLEVEGQSGSIHGLGAKLQGAPSCNGWTFWQVETAEGLKPIDSLRQTYLLATEP
jgi:modification methylase